MKNKMILTCLLSFTLCGSLIPAYGSETEQTLTIRMVGDDLIHEAVYKQCQRRDGTYNFDKIFANVKPDIESADIAIINQETIMVHEDKDASSYPCFGTPESIGHSIVSAGFDVVAHATNHTWDKGSGGILETINFWNTNYPDLLYLGIHDSPEDSDIRYLTKNDIKVGFVNYTYGLNGLEPHRKGSEYLTDMLSDPDIEDTMKEARENCELLIAILHVGEEYVYEPTEYAKKQVERFIDNGADIVLCSHPHVLEPYKMVTTKNGNQGLVYYSLGNFISSQNQVPRVLGGMAEIKVRKIKEEEKMSIQIAEYNLIPLVTHQETGNYTTYRLDQYPAELAARHKLVKKGFSIENLNILFNSIMKSE